MWHHVRGDGLCHCAPIAAKFSNDLQSSGFRSLGEIPHRHTNSKAHDQKSRSQTEKLNPAANRRQMIAIEKKAKDLLYDFVTDVGRCWKETTGHPLPQLTREVLDRCGGYRPELAVLAASHPLWVIFNAVEIKVGAHAVNHFVCYARRAAGEKISVPPIFWQVLSPY
jgi:hypothetical protein